MYKRIETINLIDCNETYEGESIEDKIERVVENNEPIEDGAPIIYTEKKDGVLPEYNIRTDRWEIAQDAMETVDKMNKAKREEKQLEKEPKTERGNEGENQPS